MAQAANTLSLTHRAEPASVPRARHALRDFAIGVQADPDLVDAICMASSEALTNAVVHAYRGGSGNVYVRAAVVDDELRIIVADDGFGLEPRADRPGLGLGLGLIAQLTSDLSIGSEPGGGTEVRMSFKLHGNTAKPGAVPEPGEARDGCGALSKAGSQATRSAGLAALEVSVSSAGSGSFPCSPSTAPRKS
jgi:anti-sigma regulatory factor (Ser/Thr protein kinase)